MSETFKDTIPEELVTHVTAICGARGEQWFADLPEIISRLEERWSVTALRPFAGIEYNYVAPAIGTNGERVVIKTAPPFERTEIHGEAKFLRVRNGEGAVRLLAEDRDLKAIMIEHALPGDALLQTFKDDPAGCIRPAIDTLKSILMPPPQDMTDVDTLDNWFDRFRRYKETKFPYEDAEKAFEIYERLSPQAGRTYYLHGDYHPGNVVTADRAPFLAIDPKGIVGHVGYDVAVFLNNLHWWRKGKPGVDGLLREAVGLFAGAFGLREREVREWAFACLVIGVWWNFEDMPQYEAPVAISDVWEV